MQLFRENNIEHEKVNYFNDALSEEKLRDLLRKAHLSAFDVVRKNEAVYKQLNVADVKDEDELIKIIVRNSSLLQRPIVEVGSCAVWARPIEKALEIINV